MSATQFTGDQLFNWRLVESVRASGRWNMISPQAREASGLSRADYLFVLEHYEALEKAVEAVDAALKGAS